ncbi:MAG: ribosomal protein S18-alanine N-acetyltransferase [Acidobacteriaceae bacterium]
MTASCWSIRHALTSDTPAILHIEQACPEAPHWSEASWREVLANKENQQPARAAFVAEDPTGVLGFAVATCTKDLSELETVAVSPPARRQGIGQALIQAAAEWSRKRGAMSMELEVRASSHGAQSLYRSLGFVEQGIRRGYYRDPSEDAVLMAANLQNDALLALPGGPVRRIVPDAKV